MPSDKEDNSEAEDHADKIEIVVLNNSEEDGGNQQESTTKTIKDLLSDLKNKKETEQENWPVCENDEYDDEFEEEDNECETARKKSKKNEANTSKTDDKSNKKRNYMQRYRKEWENIPAYKPWLSESVRGNLYFYCKFCKKDNKCGKLVIEKHMTSQKHIRNSLQKQNRVQRKFTFRGLLCPVFTPFEDTRENEINYTVIPEYAKYLKTCGVKGVLINDVVGEGMSLRCSERMRLTEEWADICKKINLHLMVHVGGAPLKDVQELVRHAERKRVDSIVVLPDAYNKPKDHYDLMRYIKIISDHANTIPLLYHHNPSVTGVNINMTKFLNDIIGEIDTFVGIIFSDNNLSEAVSALQVNENKFTVIIGSDEIMVGAFSSGFNTLMGTTLNFLPKVAQTIQEAIKLGVIKEARDSQLLLTNTIYAICRHGEWVPAMKAAMNLMAPISVGPVRPPLVEVWLAKVQKMKTELQQLKVIT